MAYRYAIHPSIGVARVGNSPDEFYLAPESIGGLPIECDQQGNVSGSPVTQFKDGTGRIKRQAARFRVFRYDDQKPNDPGVEISAGEGGIVSLEWTAHLANKKAIWYNFSEMEGNLMLGTWTGDQNSNSYASRQVGIRNSTVTNAPDRQKLIIDPGPRTLTGKNQKTDFSRHTIPPDYKHGSFPPSPQTGHEIDTLGEMLTDDDGNLLILGGFGLSGGNQAITSFAGADTWHDDIADGPVTCRLTVNEDGVAKDYDLDAWVIIGSPKFAPELVNMVTLDDIAFDVSVRYQDLMPGMYAKASWNTDYIANYKRDIEPLIRRPLDYIWVSNVPSMVAFAAPPFDTRDASEQNRSNREAYFSYFRAPEWTDESQQNQLMSGGPDNSGIPMMPLNSGSNSIWQLSGDGDSIYDTLVDKFLTLTQTQYFLLGQWAEGKFTNEEPEPLPGVNLLDRVSIGNCVGSPMAPGIEVTWSTRNPTLYASPYHIRHRFDELHYIENGLSLQDYDETDPNNQQPGCEPGDLTKRMAIPWQADFFQCTYQLVNFTNPVANKDANHIPLPPTYYAYWWPPQSPMWVMSGEMTVESQFSAGVPAGMQVFYPRGINSFTEMITAWAYLGFIVNQNTGTLRSAFPNFVERERNHDKFAVSSIAVGPVSDFMTGDNSTFWPMWFLKEQPPQQTAKGFFAASSEARRAVRAPNQSRMRDHHED